MGSPGFERKPQPATADRRTSELNVDYGLHGSSCDRQAPAARCFLDPAARARLVGELNTAADGARTNFQTALSNKRMELLLQKDDGWDFAAELMFSVLSTVVLAGVGVAAEKLARRLVTRGVWTGDIASSNYEAAIAAHKAVFEGGVKQAVGAAQTPLKQRLSGYSAKTIAHIQFVGDMQQTASEIFRRVAAEAKVGDDPDLVLATAALDNDRLTIPAFGEQIEDLLARFETSGLDELGSTKTGPVTDGTRRVVRFVHGKATRLAVIEVRERKLLGRSHGDDWYTKGGTTFLNWVDDDLSETAEQAQARHVGALETIDLADNPHWSRLPQIWSWQFGGVR